MHIVSLLYKLNYIIICDYMCVLEGMRKFSDLLLVIFLYCVIDVLFSFLFSYKINPCHTALIIIIIYNNIQYLYSAL